MATEAIFFICVASVLIVACICGAVVAVKGDSNDNKTDI